MLICFSDDTISSFQPLARFIKLSSSFQHAVILGVEVVELNVNEHVMQQRMKNADNGETVLIQSFTYEKYPLRWKNLCMSHFVF